MQQQQHSTSKQAGKKARHLQGAEEGRWGSNGTSAKASLDPWGGGICTSCRTCSPQFHVVLALRLPGPLRKQGVLLPPERLGLVSRDTHRRRPLHVRRIARHLLSLRRASIHVPMLLAFWRPYWSLLHHATHPPLSALRKHVGVYEHIHSSYLD